jgi:hypothetical protein
MTSRMKDFKARLHLLRCKTLGVDACGKRNRCDAPTPCFIGDSAIFLFAQIVWHRETSLSERAPLPAVRGFGGERLGASTRRSHSRNDACEGRGEKLDVRFR